jgi:hypothetical protein
MSMSKRSVRFPAVRRLWRPAAVTGAGGTAVAVWFEEILLFGQELLALIFLPIIAGAIYLLNLFIFNSRMPKREDLNHANDRGATN